MKHLQSEPLRRRCGVDAYVDAPDDVEQPRDEGVRTAFEAPFPHCVPLQVIWGLSRQGSASAVKPADEVQVYRRTFSILNPGTSSNTATPLRAIPKRTSSLNPPSAFWRRKPALSAVPWSMRANVMHATPARRAVLGEGGEVGSIACKVSCGEKNKQHMHGEEEWKLHTFAEDGHRSRLPSLTIRCGQRCAGSTVLAVRSPCTQRTLHICMSRVAVDACI